jgi:hypothetical protein
MDAAGNVTIMDEQGRPMSTADINKMCQDAAAESDAFHASTEDEQIATLDKLTGGLFSKMF